jgi:cytoskeletal protein CcmA (bactofilin family)
MSSKAIGARFSLLAGSSSVTTTGALNSGSITSGFGTIDTGASAITTTGLISGGSLDIDNVLINGANIGHTDDTDLIALSDGLVTVNGNITVTGTTTTNNVETVSTSSGVIFEGSAADGHDATLKSVVADSDKTYTLPNITGFVPILTNDPSTTAISATVAELNIMDGVTSTAAELNILDGVTSTAAELNILDGVTSTAAELNILDGVTSTAAELNALDGITAVVGELNALDIGSTAVGTAVASKAIILDSNKDYTGVRNFTISGELDAATLDISGNADIDGTMEADVITVNGTALAEFIADTTGAMFSSNTETNITVTYQDADNTIDVSIANAAVDAKGVVELATTDEAVAGTDTARAVTAAGLAARSYRNAYGDGSEVAHIVNHALNTRDVIVQCYDASDYKTVYACVLRTDANNVTVTTAVAAASNDLIVLVTKVD